MILDLEFKRFKTAEIREEVRQAYDNSKAKLVSLETSISMERQKPKDSVSRMAEGDIARLDDEVVRVKQEIERYQAQMVAMDNDINGANPSSENHEGVIGINQNLDSLRELAGMLKEYIKNF